jgi:class 3 adenylate cyclase
VGVALAAIHQSATAAARSEFDGTRKSVTAILKEGRKSLGNLQPMFVTPWFVEFVDKGKDPAKRESLIGTLPSELEELGIELDYFAVADAEGKVWVRRNKSHTCDAGCRHDEENSWILNRNAAVFRAAGDPFLGLRLYLPEQKGAIVLARRIRSDLETISGILKVQIALFQDGVEVYRSLPDWATSREAEGDVTIAGEHYFADRSALDREWGIELLLLRPMGKVDDERRAAILFGGAGIAVAVLLAALVSVRVSRGVSQPVENLVDAVHKVAQGDFAAKVDVTTKDEIGRLGTAFNEMTIGLRKRQEILEMTLSRDVAEEFLKGGTERGGERRVITIVFMDIRGYTSGTEGMDPADVVVMLNELMDLLAGAIERHGGLVSKFLGDGLMAMFGTPKPLENHPLHAVQAAIEMQKQMERWNQRRVARGLASFYSGIGINTGEAVCGKVGGHNRLEYTLIGEEVNLTSRICGKAAPRQVLITKQTWLKVKEHIQVKELEAVQVKGLSYPIQIYEVIS